MSPAEEVQNCRGKLRLNRSEFGRRLGLSPTAAYPQVRKWEEGIGEPSAAAMTAIRLLVELQECRRMTKEELAELLAREIQRILRDDYNSVWLGTKRERATEEDCLDFRPCAPRIKLDGTIDCGKLAEAVLGALTG